MSPDVSRTPPAAEWRRGWPVVAAAMIGIGVNPGLFQNVSSLFTTGIAAEFGWSRGQIATAAGLGLVGGLAAPFLGRLADHIGARVVIAAAMLLLGAAYLGLAAMTGGLWQYQALILCLALSVPGMSSVVYGKLVAARFTRHRGLALALATSGLSITTLAMPPILAVVIAAAGWRGGFVALAVLTAGIALPLVLLALRRAPAVPVELTAAPAGYLSGLTGAQARRSPRFWALGLTGLLINIATVGLVTQLVPFGLDRGLGAGQAALLLASYGASQLVGRFGIGVLVDHFPATWMAAGAATLSTIGFALLQFDGLSFWPLMVLVFAAGLMNGAENDLMPFLASRLFGLKAYGEIYGSLLVLALLGTAAGIVGWGRMHDATGSYDWPLTIATAAMALSGLLFLTLGRVRAPA